MGDDPEDVVLHPVAAFELLATHALECVELSPLDRLGTLVGHRLEERAPLGGERLVRVELELERAGHVSSHAERQAQGVGAGHGGHAGAGARRDRKVRFERDADERPRPPFDAFEQSALSRLRVDAEERPPARTDRAEADGHDDVRDLFGLQRAR